MTKSSKEYIPFVATIRSSMKFHSKLHSFFIPFATPDSPTLEIWKPRILTLAFASISAAFGGRARPFGKTIPRQAGLGFKRRTMSWREQAECWMLHFIDCVVDGALLWLHLYTPKTTFGPLVLVLALSRLCSFYEVVYDAPSLPPPQSALADLDLEQSFVLLSSRNGRNPFEFPAIKPRSSVIKSG